MDQRRTRRILLVAFVLSIVIHTLFAAGVRWHIGSQEETIEHVSIVHRMRIARATPPPPTPAPTPKAAPKTPSTRVKPGHGPGEARTVAVAPTPQPTPAATPAASATPNCASEDTQAALAATPPPVDIPANARGEGTSGTTHVRVDLDAGGVVKATTITSSSGNTGLDLVAETMARTAQYTPATHACKAVASTYDFTAKFVAW